MAGLVAGTVGTSGGGGGGGGTSSTDESNFQAGQTAGTPDMGVYNDALAALSAGLLAISRITAYRAHHVNLRDASGNEEGTSGNPLWVQGSFSAGIIKSATPNDPVQATVGTSAAQALAANTSRLWVVISNFGQTVLYYLFGSSAQAGAVSSSNCTNYLNPGQSVLIAGSQIFTGVIQWISSAAGGVGNIQDGDA